MQVQVATRVKKKMKMKTNGFIRSSVKFLHLIGSIAYNTEEALPSIKQPKMI